MRWKNMLGTASVEKGTFLFNKPEYTRVGYIMILVLKIWEFRSFCFEFYHLFLMFSQLTHILS